MLRGTVNHQVTILCRFRHGDLAFEIKLVLPTQADVTLQAVLGSDNRFATIATLQRLAWQHEGFLFDSLAWLEYGIQLLVLDVRQSRGLACLVHSNCCDREDRLANIFDQSGRENWVIGKNRAKIIFTRYVICGHHSDDTWCCQHRRKIDVGYVRVWPATQSNRHMQQTLRLDNVIRINCAAQHMQFTTVVRNRRTNRTDDGIFLLPARRVSAHMRTLPFPFHR